MKTNEQLTAEFNKAYGTNYLPLSLEFTERGNGQIYVQLYCGKPDEWKEFYYTMTYHNRQTYGGVASRHRKGFRISPLTKKRLEEKFNLY